MGSRRGDSADQLRKGEGCDRTALYNASLRMPGGFLADNSFPGHTLFLELPIWIG